MESPMNRPFELRPETLNRVGVNVALDVLPVAVVDGFVKMPDRSDLVVGVRFIGRNNRTRRHHSLNERHQSDLLDVFNRSGFNLTFPFDSTKHRRLASSTTTTFSTANTANVSFIQFDDLLPVQWIRRLLHKHPNLFSDSPRTFVCDAKMTLQFLRCHPIFALAHHENGVKPHSKWCRAFVENCPFGWISLVAASTSIRSAVSDWMERRLSALRAFQPLWITLLENMSQASLVVREVLFEVFNGVAHV